MFGHGLTHFVVLGSPFNLFDGPSGLIILIIALLLFGSRLPDIARSMGRTIVQFKKGLKESNDELNAAGREDQPQKPAAPLPSNPRQIKQITSVTDEP
ncbi:MAG TPA: twin-arginine translocase TatA/TatE family subunit [Phycisphaerae bacterium]|nr:twin-arginine translocase TatA/TatE family subunit [Phycisphaerae bacterium]